MSDSESFVTAIVPTYNRSKLVVQALDSLLGQIRRPDRIIVVDDGSTDGTGKALRQRYGTKIEYIYQSNAGKSAALNRALNSVEKGYVWIIDDDDLVIKNALQLHLAYLRAHPYIDFTYSGCYQFTGLHSNPTSAESTIDDYPEPLGTEFFIWCLTVFPFFMQSMLVPKDCYSAVGPFDEELLAGEDYDMILRLARYFRGGKVSEPTFCLRRHNGMRGSAHIRHQENERHKVWREYDLKIFRKVYSDLSLKEYLPSDSAKTELTDIETRRALLQRACVMTRRGLLEEALADLEAATQVTLNREPYSQAERLICARLMDLKPPVVYTCPDFVRRVGKMVRRRAVALLADCVKGYTWSIRRELRKRNYRAVMFLIRNLPFLIGLRGLPQTLKAVRRKA